MPRVDHFDDPSAPTPTTRVAGCSAAVRDARGRILLILREDARRWALPGGLLEIDESVTEAAVRETREETGVDIEVTGLVGIYSDPRHVTELHDGRVVTNLALCFRARAIGGEARPDGVETLDVAWVEPDEVLDRDLWAPHRPRLRDVLADRSEPRLS